jgi:hypothetical protein
LKQNNTKEQFSSRTQVNGQYLDDNVPAEELSAVLRALYQPENYKYDMHRRALENALENMLVAARESDYYDQYDDEEKRSIATLAKNGQLPSKEPDTEMDTLDGDDNGHKRNIASMARSGLIGGKRNIQALARQWQFANGKRNIGSVMRTNMFAAGKRNPVAMARNGFGKRNVGTLARDWALPKFTGEHPHFPPPSDVTPQNPKIIAKNPIFPSTDGGKRNIQALKSSLQGGRKKREAGNGEALEPVYQTGPIDYEELLQSLNEDFPYMMQNPAEKRFLGKSKVD